MSDRKLIMLGFFITQIIYFINHLCELLSSGKVFTLPYLNLCPISLLQCSDNAVNSLLFLTSQEQLLFKYCEDWPIYMPL